MNKSNNNNNNFSLAPTDEEMVKEQNKIKVI